MQVLAQVDAQPFMSILGQNLSPQSATGISATKHNNPAHSETVTSGKFDTHGSLDDVPVEVGGPRRSSPIPSKTSSLPSIDAPDLLPRGGSIQPELAWESPVHKFPDIASMLQSQFETAVASSLELASTALRLLSPELQVRPDSVGIGCFPVIPYHLSHVVGFLQEGGQDWRDRMANLVAAADTAKAQVSSCLADNATIRLLHDTTLAQVLYEV